MSRDIFLIMLGVGGYALVQFAWELWCQRPRRVTFMRDYSRPCRDCSIDRTR